MSEYIMVLNDGETFTDLEGCYVLHVPEEVEDVEEFMQSDDAFSNIQALFGTDPDGKPFMVGKIPKLNATVTR